MSARIFFFASVLAAVATAIMLSTSKSSAQSSLIESSSVQLASSSATCEQLGSRANHLRAEFAEAIQNINSSWTSFGQKKWNETAETKRQALIEALERNAAQGCNQG